MNLPHELSEALNNQVTMEFEAAVVYRQLSIDMAAIDLPGIAGWFEAQAEEEQVHAAKFADHMLDRGVAPLIQTLQPSGRHAETVLAAFEAALSHEKKVSESIRNIYRLAQNTGDIDSLPLLTWFVSEQLEEESTVSAIIGRIKLIGEDGNGLIGLDAELGRRPSADLGVGQS